MTKSPTDKPGEGEGEGPPIGPYHLMAFISLATVFLTQMQRGNAAGAVLVLGGGVLSVWGKLSRGPILFLVLMAGSQLLYRGNGVQLSNEFRPAWFDLYDLLLCAGVLGFVAAHCRLQSIWDHHLALDSRRRLPKPDRWSRSRRQARGPVEPQRRAPANVNPQEVSLLIASLPLWVVAAQFSAARLPGSGIRIMEIEPWLMRIMLVVSALGLGIFVVVSLLDQWKRRTMSRAAAWVFLQDTVWRETRGEQRRLERWRAWQRLRNKHP